MLATSLGFAVVQLDVSVVNVAVKSIGARLAGDLSALQWVVDAYTMAFAALILSAGALGDRIGAKRVFLAGFALFTAASVGCGLAPTMSVLIAARIVQGIGAAALVPCSLTLLNHAYPKTRDRARAVGIWAAAGSVALSAGPLLGGVLIASSGWRAIFFVNIPIGVLAIVLTAWFVTDTTRSHDRGFDLPGQLLAVVGLIALTGAMVEAGRLGPIDPLVLAAAAVALVSIGAFVLVEWRRKDPMLPLGLFRSATFAGSSAIGLLVNIAFYGLIFVLSLYFQTTQHYSALTTGLAFAPTTVAVLVANLSAGRLTGAFGTRRMVIVAALLMAASLAALLIARADTGFAHIMVQLIALGFALGLIVPAITSALLGSVDASRSGIASGTLNSARQTGSVVGVALFGSRATGDLVGGLRLAVTVSIGLALVIALLAVRIDS